MRNLIMALSFAFMFFFPSIVLAQNKQVSHHVDFLQTNSLFNLMRFGLNGLNGEHPVAGISGYHFTALQMKRLNTLGLGVAWLGVNSSDSTSAYQDVAITMPLANIRIGRLSHGDEVRSPVVYFNVNYGYGLIHKKHGIFMGISFGT